MRHACKDPKTPKSRPFRPPSPRLTPPIPHPFPAPSARPGPPLSPALLHPCPSPPRIVPISPSSTRSSAPPLLPHLQPFAFTPASLSPRHTRTPWPPFTYTPGYPPHPHLSGPPSHPLRPHGPRSCYPVLPAPPPPNYWFPFGNFAASPPSSTHLHHGHQRHVVVRLEVRLHHQVALPPLLTHLPPPLP